MFLPIVVKMKPGRHLNTPHLHTDWGHLCKAGHSQGACCSLQEGWGGHLPISAIPQGTGTLPPGNSPPATLRTSCLRTYTLLLFALQEAQLRSRREDLSTTAPASRAEQLWAGSRAQPWRRARCTRDCRPAALPSICFLITSEELKASQSTAVFSTLHFRSGWLNEGKDPTREHPLAWSTDLQHGQAALSLQASSSALSKYWLCSSATKITARLVQSLQALEAV